MAVSNSLNHMEKTTLKLRTGDEMPLVGFGTWKVPRDSCPEIVYQTLKAGYKCLDCACDYGNEDKVGEGIKRALDEGILQRKDLWVTSKLWNTFHRPEHVKPACQRTLKDLRLEYLDLYLIHFPISLKYVDPETRYPPEWIYDTTANKPCMVEDPVPIIETWRAMEQLVKDGLVKNIGVCNFNTSLLRDLIAGSTIKPSVLQVELHPELTQKKLIDFCRQQNIQMTSFSSFGASSYVELSMAQQNDLLLNNEVIKSIAAKNNKTPGQVLLKWSVQQNIAVIPKTSKVERLGENSDLFGWSLSAEDMQAMDSLNKNRRYNDPGHFCQVAFNSFFPIYE